MVIGHLDCNSVMEGGKAEFSKITIKINTISLSYNPSITNVSY